MSMFAYGELNRKGKVRYQRHAESLAANYSAAMDLEGELYLGAQLKLWRKSRRLTLDQLASDIETSKGYLSEMERNKKPLSSRWLAKISEFYKVPVSEIIGAASPPMSPDQEIAQIADQIRRLKGLEKLDQVRSYLNFLEAEAQSAQSPGAEDAQARPKTAKSGQ